MMSPNPTSPALSAASSFVLLENQRSPAVYSDDSEDEIVYSVPDDSFSSSNGSSASDPASDDDFVVLSRRRANIVALTGISTPNGDYPGHQVNTSSLAAHLEKLSVEDPTPVSSGSARKPRKAKKSSKSPTVAGAGMTPVSKVVAQPSTEVAAASYPSPDPSPKQSLSSVPAATQPSTSVVKAPLKKSRKKKKKKKATGLGARSVVDDASERFSEYGGSENGSPTIYDEAVGYITSFLSNPAAHKDSACRLTLLQALIIELGLASSSLPASLTSAKAYLKTRAFLNIRDYLAVREQGPAAVQSIMHPSRSSLIKDIKRNKNKVPRRVAKDSGLQVLLVECYH